MAEREMSRHQRGMVDGCFEEGHYQQGISALDQLRLQQFRPSPAHVRQLIYIALYPPKDATKDKRKRTEHLLGITASPSKLQHVRRLQKQSLLPPPEASEAAWLLLHQLAITTNSPEALLRAVPCYPLSEAELAIAPRTIDASMFGNMELREDPDSYVAKHAACLNECKDCWSMLRADVVVRQDVSLITKRNPFCDFDDYIESDPSPVPIGKGSWRLLDLFIQLFERDQELVDNRESECHSIYLLSQIKPVRSSSGEMRADPEAALEIIFTCYSQTDRWRRGLGRRLMALLVALTSSRYFSPSHFLTSTSTRLQACSKAVLSAFLNDLPSGRRGRAVKLAICDRYLIKSLRDAVGADSGVKGARAQARRARPVPVQRDGETGSPKKLQVQARTPEGPYPWTLPTTQRVLQLLGPESNIRSPSEVSLARLAVLYHLVATFGIVKGEESAKTSETDQPWVDALKTGELEKNIGETFSDERLPEGERTSVQPMRLSLMMLCTRWKQGHL